MRLSRLGTCFAIAGVYLAMRFAPLLFYKGIQKPWLWLGVSLLLTAVTMLVQLAFAMTIVRLQMKAYQAALIAVASGLAVVGALMAMKALRVHPALMGMMHGTLPMALGAAKDFFLIIGAVSLGYLVSFIVREPNILLPAALFAGLVDYLGVTWGPVGQMLQSHPETVAKASVHMPAVAIHIANKPRVIDSMIGMGDFLFFALFMGVLYRFALNVKGAFWFGYAFLTAFMLFVTFSPWNVAIPALVPMGVAILATNAHNFKLKREELLAIVYVGIILLVGIIVAWFWMHRHQPTGGTQKHRISTESTEKGKVNKMGSQETTNKEQS